MSLSLIFERLLRYLAEEGGFLRRDLNRTTLAAQLLVDKGAFHQSLTIVECSVDLNRRDVLSERRELTFLNGTDFSFWIKHIYPNSFDSQKAIGHSTTRITRSCNKHI